LNPVRLLILQSGKNKDYQEKEYFELGVYIESPLKGGLTG